MQSPPEISSDLAGEVRQLLIGEPFVFSKIGYGDELILHFGTEEEFELPRFGTQYRGSVVVSVRGSRWVSKPVYGRATSSDQDSDPELNNNSIVVEATVVPVDGQHGLTILLSDGTRFSILPTPAEPADDQPLCDWEVRSPRGYLRVGPGAGWAFTPKDHSPRIKLTDRFRLPEPTANEFLEHIKIPEYVWQAPTKGAGFPAFRVFDVWVNYNSFHSLRWHNLEASIRIKHDVPFSDMIIVGESGTQRGIVLFAFRLFPDLMTVPLAEVTPLAILRAFVERFGLEFTLGRTKKKKFFLTEVISLRPGTNFQSIVSATFNKNLGVFFSYLIEPKRDKANIALAVLINQTEYAKWLNRNSE